MKKIIAMLLVVALTAAISVGATLAYLTDTDEDVNVMTLGNVQIAQHEYERVLKADGTYETITVTKADGSTQESYKLQPFTQAKPLYPVVGDPNGGYTTTYARFEQLDKNASGGQQFLAGIKNGQDKIVLVENTGKSDAYVRTIFAFEMGSVTEAEWKELIQPCRSSSSEPWGYNFVGEANIGGYDYFIIEAVYNGYSYGNMRHNGGILPAGEWTYNSLAEVYLVSSATNEDCAALDGNNNGTYDILVLSQAVQTEGFADAQTALDAAFGTAAEKTAEWFGGMKTPSVVEVKTGAELAEAVANNESAIIKLSEGKFITNFEVKGGKDITIVGTGANTVLSGQIATTASNAGTLTIKNVTINVDSSIVDSTGISQTGKSAIAIWGDQTVICENVTFNMSLADSTAITSWWDTGVGTSIVVRNCTFNCNGQRPIRATGNVTVENTTFNDPYRYAVQLTAKASTATELDKAVVNFVNNTIVNGENGKAFVYGLQLEGADYGCHDLVINGSGNTIKDGGEDSTMYYCECGKVDHDTLEWNVEVDPVHEG